MQGQVSDRRTANHNRNPSAAELRRRRRACDALSNAYKQQALRYGSGGSGCQLPGPRLGPRITQDSRRNLDQQGKEPHMVANDDPPGRLGERSRCALRQCSRPGEGSENRHRQGTPRSGSTLPAMIETAPTRRYSRMSKLARKRSARRPLALSTPKTPPIAIVAAQEVDGSTRRSRKPESFSTLPTEIAPHLHPAEHPPPVAPNEKTLHLEGLFR